MDPGGRGRGIAVVVLGVQCPVGEAAICLLLLALLLQQIGDGVQKVVQEFVGILLHVVVKQLWRGGGWTERDVSPVFQLFNRSCRILLLD